MTAPQSTGIPVTLPSLGENVAEGTITRWLKASGDHVELGEALLEVATDKVDTEIPSPITGTILEIVAAEGDLVAVETVLAIIGAPDQPGGTPAMVIAAPRGREPALANEPVIRLVDSTPSTDPLVSSEPTTHRGARVERLPKIRQTIARRMLDSLRTTAQLTTVIEADITGITRLRAACKDEFVHRTGVKLSFLPFFAKATVEALGQHPLVNSAINDAGTEVTYHESVHLGMAVDSVKGLMVPVIRDAQHMTITRLATATEAVADNVRSGQIRPDALVGGTFTITNTGSRGALFDTPILNSPQSGILGTGAVVERVVPQCDSNGATAFGVRSMVYLALTYDHRIVDGADAARFLGSIKQRLEAGFTAEDLR